jgi:hypothetical protein
LVRGAVEEAMEVAPPDSLLGQIYSEFLDMPFCELDKEEFADAYVQTLAYGLKRGSYCTPPAVVNFQTRVINQLLVNAFHRWPRG